MLTDWRLAATAILFCCAVLFTCIETSAQQVPKEIAARTEIYAIPSLTISDHQFLTGDSNGKPVTVGGEFRIAQGSGRFPYITYDNKYIESVWWLLQNLYKKNLLYKGYTIQLTHPQAGQDYLHTN